MIQLRQAIEAGLRHPLLGPLLLLMLGLILAFVILHTVEHGVEGLLFSCSIVAAVSLRLVVVLDRTWRATTHQPLLPGRSPPRRTLRILPAGPVPTGIVSLPLRL